jgi:hypothetical protein
MEAKQLIALCWESESILSEVSEGACPCELLHSTFLLVDCLQPLLRLRVAATEGVFEGGKVRIELDDACKG